MWGRWIFKTCVSSWVFTSMSMCQFQKVCSLQVFSSDSNSGMICFFIYNINRILFIFIYIYITIIPIYIPNLMILQPHWNIGISDFKEGTFETSDRGTGSVTFLPARGGSDGRDGWWAPSWWWKDEFTPPKTNMEPKNDGFLNRNLLFSGAIFFQVPC